MFPGVIYALLAGFLGAVASSSAKLSLGADYLKGVCETGLRTWGEQRRFRQPDETTACDWVRPAALIYTILVYSLHIQYVYSVQYKGGRPILFALSVMILM
jgi:hypothetical protein